MSDAPTPRTDEFYGKLCRSSRDWFNVSEETASFARQLERELAAEREANDQLSHGLKFIRAALNCDSSKLDVIVPAIKALTTKLAIAREALDEALSLMNTAEHAQDSEWYSRADKVREALDKIK